jgi:hypothetical protein
VASAFRAATGRAVCDFGVEGRPARGRGARGKSARLTATRDKTAAEVIRVATDGTPNACSFLYARAKRAAQALGFVRVRTKTLPEEGGGSLRAVGAKPEGATAAQSWDRVNRRRAQSAPVCQKLRWEL